MNLGKGRLGTGLLVLVAGVGLGACAPAPIPMYTGMYVVPHSQTAVIAGTSSHGFVINKSLVRVKGIDGENSPGYETVAVFLRPLPTPYQPDVYGQYYGSMLGSSGPVSSPLRVLPGRHTLRVHVWWGLLGLYNQCYSDVEFMTEAGREYEFDVERHAGETNVLALDDSGVVVGKGICEPCSFFDSGCGDVENGTDNVTPRGERSPSG